MKKLYSLLMPILFLLITPSVYALTYALPTNGQDVVGQLQQAELTPETNLHQIARRYDVGYDALLAANPGLTPNTRLMWEKVVVPTKFILPPGPHKGIVVNLPEMRLFYYRPKLDEVVTFPVAIGLLGWATPTGDTQIIQKINHPTWYVPTSVHKELAAKGIVLPKFIPPGPEDPLGDFALRLGIPGYLMHGTNRSNTIGTRASSGCIRLYPKDIQTLFGMVPLHTKVRIINDPYLIGWQTQHLMLQAYEPLQNKADSVQIYNQHPMILKLMREAQLQHAFVDWQHATQAALCHTGIPTIVNSH